MEDIPYSKREIDHYIDEIRDLFAEHKEDDLHHFNDIKGGINALTVEVRKTNGKVKKIIIAIVLMFGIVIGFGGKEIILPILSIII